MSNTLNTTLSLDINNWLASAKQAGDVTDREFTKMQRLVKALNTNLGDMARYGKEAANSPKGLEQTAKHMEHVGFATAGAKRELLVLAHELSQGNYSRFGGSMLVLAERTNAAELAFSAMGLSVLAATAAVAAIIGPAIAGHLEMDKFAKSLIATGNAGGLTADSFASLASAVSTIPGGTIGKARESLQDLISTGQLLPGVMGMAAKASLNWQKITGQSSEEVAKTFAKMRYDVTKWVEEHNTSMHFATISQYAYIKSLEDQGKSEEAQREALQLLNGQLQSVNGELERSASFWERIKTAAGEYFDLMKKIGRPETVGDRIDKLQSSLPSSDAQDAFKRTHSRTEIDRYNLMIGRIREQLAAERELARNDDSAATSRADSAALDQRRISAAKFIDTLLLQYDRTKALEKAMRDFHSAEQLLKGTPLQLTQDQHNNLENRIREKYAEKSKLDPNAYKSLLIDIGKYNEETEITAGTMRKIADYDKWAADMRARLAHETEKLTATEKKNAEAKIISARASREYEETEGEMKRMINKINIKGRARDEDHQMPFETARANAITDYFRDVGDQTKRAEALVTGSFTRMEDAIVNFAKTGKLSFSDLFGYMAEEFIRNQIKMAEKSLLTDSAGNFIGIGNLFAKAGSFMAGLPGFANGLDYVPHDNYPAMLHEGERVLTRQDAANGSARGGINIDGSITIGSVGSGTSRAEVFAAVQQASAQTKASIMRTLKQHGVTA